MRSASIVPPVSQTYRQRAFAVPPDATELIVIRHGASAAARAGRAVRAASTATATRRSPPRAATQAQPVAERLHGEPLRALFVTPLQRTAQTAAPLVAATGLEPKVIPDLREVHLGDWEGGEYRRRMHERDPIAMRALIEQRWDVIPGAEPMDALAARVGAGLDAMLAAIGPGGAAAAVAARRRDRRAVPPGHRQRGRSRSSTPTTARSPGSWRSPSGHRLLRTFNDTAHLA